MTISGDTLLDRLKGGDPDDGETANDLLTQLFRGYPVERIRVLLYSENPDAASVGAFLASELGRRGRPLLGDYVQLLRHPSARVRADLVDAILCSATSQAGEAVAAAVRMIDDPDSDVRYQAVQLLACAKRDKLAAASPHLAGTPLDALVAWLLEVDRTSDHESVIECIGSEERTDRLFGAAAAYRLAVEIIERPGVPAHGSTPATRYLPPLRVVRDLRSLRAGAESTDAEVRWFAQGRLEIILMPALKRTPPHNETSP